MDKPTVNTVLGGVLASSLGRVLPHEHVFIDMMSITGIRGQRLDNFERMRFEMSRLVPNLPCTVVDVTPIGVGRNPLLLKRISEDLGINFVVSTGFYRPRWYPEIVDKWDSEAIAQVFIKEIFEGIDDTGIKAGIIGELGTEKPWVNPAEERVLIAAGQAQVETGLTITLHSYGSAVGAQQVKILLKNGVKAGRIIVGHCDTYPDSDSEIKYFRLLADLGCWIQFDTIRTNDNNPWIMELRAVWVKKLIDAGHGHQVLLSHDICESGHLFTSGGEGYRTLWDNFISYLVRAGVDSDQIERLLTSNPQQALVGEPISW